MGVSSRAVRADVHTNLFWSYGNAALENNCTRALVISLDACGPRTTSRFLREFAGCAGTPPFSVALQAAPKEIRSNVPGARVLAITTNHADRVALRISHLRRKLRLDSESPRAIPDAWILDARSRLCLLIESKLGSSLDLEQLGRHWRAHLGRDVPRAHIHATWEAVGDFFAGEIARGKLTPRAKYVAKEFTEYLDLLGLMPFVRFQRHHFERNEVRDGFEKLISRIKRIPGFSRGWTKHPWTEPDADFRRGRRLGNTGLAFWDALDGLAVKFALGAGARAEVDAVLTRASNPLWLGSVRAALSELGPFRAEVKVRAQFANAQCYVPVLKYERASAGDLTDILRKLSTCHVGETWGRTRLVRWLRRQGAEEGDLQGLDGHQRFHVYGHLLVNTNIPAAELIDRDLNRIAQSAAKMLNDMERVREAFSEA